MTPQLLLAQTATESFETIEVSLPESATGLLLLLAGLALLMALTVRISLRDSRFLSWPWRLALASLRLAVLSGLIVILLNPGRRTQTSRIEPSRVGILVDTSLSMSYPADGPAAAGETDAAAASSVSRMERVRSLLIEDGLLQRLSQTHVVSVYTFDTKLRGPLAVVQNGRVSRIDPDGGPSDVQPPDGPDADWTDLLTAQGSETCLAESLNELVGRMAGRTLAGIVLFSDGQSNTGPDVSTVRQRLEQTETRVIAVGTGSPVPQCNLSIAAMQAPGDVHRGDPFDVTVVVQGNGAGTVSGIVELYEQSADGDGSDRRKVDEQPFTVPADTLPVPLKFTRQLNIPGSYEYLARAVVHHASTPELTEDDNQKQCAVEVTDRRIRVLLISSGPMREYRFVRNILYRHSGIDSDVWLQTISEDDIGMVSQEAGQLLTGFPPTAAELAEYHVIVAFDPDWTRLSGEQRSLLKRWVQRDAGGLIVVAGELHTPQLAAQEDELRDVAVLYPVVVNRLLAELRLSQGSDQAWPVRLTPEGRASQFLRIEDAQGHVSTDLWKTFTGIYRSYPVRRVRDGAVVLATYENPRARTQYGAPPFLATQFYGAGRTFFIGSAETWRLRAISPEGHQRFWTGLIREAGQGRRQQGSPRGLLLLDRTTAGPGQPVTIEARLYDPRMEPLDADSVPVGIVDSNGRPVSVPDRLRRMPGAPGRYSAVFRPLRPGQYRVSVPVPDSDDVLQTDVDVSLSNLEAQASEQNEELLTRLVRNTIGRCLPLAECRTRLPELLPDRSELVITDEQLVPLWDRSAVMYLLIALLSSEWLLRRFVRLS